MPPWSVKKKWWGFKLSLSHSEACTITAAGMQASSIATWFGGWVGALIAAGIFLNMLWIHAQNENSRGKGVTLYFLWNGTLFNVTKSGSGSSPC